MARDGQLAGIDLAAYAPNGDPCDDVTNWTGRSGHRTLPERADRSAGSRPGRAGGGAGLLGAPIADPGLRMAAIWLLRGTCSGVPAHGPVNGAPVAVPGSSHFGFRRGKVIPEWRMYDEIAVIAQIVRAGAAPA